MAMLDAAARAWMKANTQVIHDDWKRSITIRKLAADQSAQTDELGWKVAAAPVYQFSYTVNAIVHPSAVVHQADKGRQDATYTVSGKQHRVQMYARVFTDELGANPVPDTDCEAVIDSKAYRIPYVDLAANQYLLGLSSEV
jgi:hypothetical protein